MPFGGLCAKAVVKAVEKLLGQRDFRQENQHLPARIQRLGDRFKINLRLARPRHTIEQRNRKTTGFDGFRQHFGGCLLVLRKRGARIIRIGLCNHGWRRQHDFFKNALRLQAIHDRQRYARRMGKAGACPGKPVAGKLHHAGASRSHALWHALRLAGTIAKPRHRRFGVEGGRHAQNHARHHAGRRKRIIGCPAHEAQHLRPH